MDSRYVDLLVRLEINDFDLRLSDKDREVFYMNENEKSLQNEAEYVGFCDNVIELLTNDINEISTSLIDKESGRQLTYDEINNYYNELS